MALAEGDRVMVYHHANGTKLGKGTVVESPALHFATVMRHYVRVQITHPLTRSIPRNTEVMVAKRNCKRLVAKAPSESA